MAELCHPKFSRLPLPFVHHIVHDTLTYTGTVVIVGEVSPTQENDDMVMFSRKGPLGLSRMKEV